MLFLYVVTNDREQFVTGAGSSVSASVTVSVVLSPTLSSEGEVTGPRARARSSAFVSVRSVLTRMVIRSCGK